MKFYSIRTWKRKLKKKKNALKALTCAALLIPGIGLNTVSAQTSPKTPTVRFEFLNYREFQNDKQSRMKISSPSIMFNSPINETMEIEGGFVLDSMSGASPQYHSSLSGASGLGIKDERRAVDLKLTKYFDRISIGLGGSFSEEDDYRSKSTVIEARSWTEDKNTIFTLAFSPSFDRVESSNDPTLDRKKTSGDIQFGITQVIDEFSNIQSSITHSSVDGFQSDPYKIADNRPSSRERWSFLTRYRHYFKDMGSSFHADYRYYFDSWAITSHMIELALYQPITESVTIRPSLRYYSQRHASFFSPTFPPENLDNFYSTDERMGDFGGVTVGLKLIKDIGDGWTVDSRIEYLQQSPDLKLGGHLSSPIETLHAYWFGIGITKKF